MTEITPRDKKDIQNFKDVTGSDLIELNRYLSGEWKWHDLWDYNFKHVNSSRLNCICKFEALRASGRREGYPLSIQKLESLGCQFTLISGGASWYVDAYYKCQCGQKWKQVFVEAMQYNGNHAYPIKDDEI